MNRQANILFMPSSIKGDLVDFEDGRNISYLRLIYPLLTRRLWATEGFQLVGRNLAYVTRRAYLARRMDVVEQASQAMLALPSSGQLKGVARFYQALCVKQKGDFDSARQLLEQVVEEASPQYRARALQIIGATYYEQGEIDTALPFYVAAGKASIDNDLLTLAESQRMIAVVRSIDGNHKQALADLENLFPLIRALSKHHSALYYSFLNSLAVELGEMGRIREAESALSIALTSPFAAAYPEWAETRDEIAAKRLSATPSIVTINRSPEADPQPQPQPGHKSKPLVVIVSRWPANQKSYFQTSILLIVEATIYDREVIASILDKVRDSIQSRAPPVCR